MTLVSAPVNCDRSARGARKPIDVEHVAALPVGDDVLVVALKQVRLGCGVM